MRRYVWVYIVVVVIIVMISVLTCRNEKAYHKIYIQEQKKQTARDSVDMQLVIGVDTLLQNKGQITERIRELSVRIDSAQRMQEKQIEMDSMQVRELRQIKSAIHTSSRKSEK